MFEALFYPELSSFFETAETLVSVLIPLLRCLKNTPFKAHQVLPLHLCQNGAKTSPIPFTNELALMVNSSKVSIGLNAIPTDLMVC